MLKELDGVRLLTDLPDQGLAKGTVGTIVLVHTKPTLAYEVEFMQKEGETLALAPEQIEPL